MGLLVKLRKLQSKHNKKRLILPHSNNFFYEMCSEYFKPNYQKQKLLVFLLFLVNNLFLAFKFSENKLDLNYK